MKKMLKWFGSIYCAGRRWIFSRHTWQRFTEFSKLPEMKISKTVGFVLSILL